MDESFHADEYAPTLILPAYAVKKHYRAPPLSRIGARGFR